MILVDTSVLISFFKGESNPAVQAFRSVLTQNIPFGINSLIFQEVLQGSKTEKEYRQLKKYLGTQRFYQPKHPVDSFDAAARIYFKCRKKGITIRSSFDCLIAQIAIENNLLLLHEDKDFISISTVAPLKFFPIEQA